MKLRQACGCSLLGVAALVLPVVWFAWPSWMLDAGNDQLQELVSPDRRHVAMVHSVEGLLGGRRTSIRLRRVETVEPGAQFNSLIEGAVHVGWSDAHAPRLCIEVEGDARRGPELSVCDGVEIEIHRTP